MQYLDGHLAEYGHHALDQVSGLDALIIPASDVQVDLDLPVGFADVAVADDFQVLVEVALAAAPVDQCAFFEGPDRRQDDPTHHFFLRANILQVFDYPFVLIETDDDEIACPLVFQSITTSHVCIPA